MMRAVFFGSHSAIFSAGLPPFSRDRKCTVSGTSAARISGAMRRNTITATDKCIGWRPGLEKWGRISMAGAWFQMDGLGQFQDERFLGIKNFCGKQKFSLQWHESARRLPVLFTEGEARPLFGVCYERARTAH